MSRTPKTSEPDVKQLTNVELEIMQILWNLGEGSVHHVLEKLPPERKLAYTSVSTMLRILEQKGVVKAKKVGRGHYYAPKLEKAEFEANSVAQLVHKVFNDTPSYLVRTLLSVKNLSKSELDEIRALIETKASE